MNAGFDIALSVADGTVGANADQTPERVTPQHSQETMLKAAVLLLEGLSHNVMSGDVWWLSAKYASSRAADANLSDEELKSALNRLLDKIHNNRASNPMSSMF